LAIPTPLQNSLARGNSIVPFYRMRRIMATETIIACGYLTDVPNTVEAGCSQPIYHL
jgi:hypothetical protein